MILREKLVDFARLHKLSRLSVGCGRIEEPIVTFNMPTVAFSGIQVEIDAAGFLQASQLADEVLSEVVSSYLPQSFTKAADLFCGRGTFTFLLAKYAKVYAAEMDESASKALKKLLCFTIYPFKLSIEICFRVLYCRLNLINIMWW